MRNKATFKSKDDHEFYDRLVYANTVPEIRSESGRVLGAKLADYFSEKGVKCLKVLDVGCGLGNLSIPVLQTLIQRGFDIKYNGIDSSETVIKRFNASQSAISAKGKFCKFTTTPTNVEEYLNNSPESPNLIFCFFVLHHLDNWSLVLERLADLLEEGGILAYHSFEGDYASWSRCFDKVDISTSDSSGLDGRIELLREIRRYHLLCEDLGKVFGRDLSASDVHSATEHLVANGYLVDDPFCEVRYKQKISMQAWVDVLKKAPTAFTMIPSLDATERSSIANQLNETVEAEMNNVIRFVALVKGRRPPKLPPLLVFRNAARNRAVEAFAELWRHGHYDSPDQMGLGLSRDYSILRDFGFLENELFSVSVGYDPLHKRWDPDQRVFSGTKPNEIWRLSSMFLFSSYLSRKLSLKLGELPTFTEAIYRNFGRKCIVDIRGDCEEQKTSIELTHQGFVRKILFFIPVKTLKDSLLTLKDSLFFDSPEKDSERVSVKDFIPKFSEVIDREEIASRFDPVWDCCKNEIAKEVRNVLSYCQRIDVPAESRSVHAGSMVWPTPSDDEVEVFAGLLLSSALSTERMIHIPASVSIELDSGDPEMSREFATGGLIVYGNSKTRVDSREIQRCLQLRQRSLFLERHKQAATILQRANAIKSATAAIMSRNLSHNVGSHALANSRFYESVGILHEVAKSPADDGREPFRKSDANKLTEGEVWRARQRLGTFNGFIQGRLDFIARALGESSSPPEPLFFFGDLMQGFFSQRVLLNTLLSDNGITIENMEFHIRLPKMEHPVVYKGVGDEHNHGNGELRHIHFEKNYHQEGDGKVGKGGDYSVDCVNELKDVLISVPGGMVGRHAFYAFLENIMRNAAKYGTRPEGESDETKTLLVVRLTVKEGAARQRDDGSGAKDVPCYWLEIDDNRSIDEPKKPEKGKKKGTEGEVARTVRVHLNDPIITDDGKPQSEGHGIQEMKVCAEFLAGQDLCFPIDDDFDSMSNVTLNGKDFWDKGDPYRDYISDKGRRYFLRATYKDDKNRCAWIKAENPLLAYNRRLGKKLKPVKKGGSPHLSYRLILQKPVVYGIVDMCDTKTASATESADVIQAEKEPSVFFYKDIKTLARNPAHFGLILLKDRDSLHEIIKQIALYHYALPYRLLLVVPDTKVTINRKKIPIQRACQNVIEEATAGMPGTSTLFTQAEEKDFEGNSPPKGCLPARRVFAVTCGELFNKQDKSPLYTKDTFPAFSPPEDDQKNAESARPGLKIFCEIYDAWLLAWKGTPPSATNAPKKTDPKWILWIGMDRASNDDVVEKWDALRSFQSNRVQVKVKARGIDHGVQSKNYADPHKGTPPGAFIVYDNHGDAFENEGADFGYDKSIAEGPRCYHAFSGSGQIELFNALDTPPKDDFGFAFHIFSLLEASLMTVVVVDERLAESMVAGGELATGQLIRLQRSGVFPLFQIRSVDGKDGKEIDTKGCPLSPDVGQALHMERPQWRQDLRSKEGMALHNDGQSVVTPFGCFLKQDQMVQNDPQNQRKTAMNPEAPDALVVHEGVLDLFRDWWKPGRERDFYRQTPFFVRTSGRGSGSRHDGDHLPFLEFSELSQNTYQSQNKLSLAKSLLSLRGHVL